MKQILIIADSIENFKIKGDSTYFMLLTAYDMGFKVSYCNPRDLYALNNQAFAKVHTVNIQHGLKDIHSTLDWFEKEEATVCELSNFSAIFVRNDPPFNMEYYYLTQILQLAEKTGVKVVNSTYVLRNFNEKLSILNFPDLITPTLVSKDKQVIADFIATHKDCIVKPIDLMGGRGIFKISHEDPNYTPILEALTNDFEQTIMVQKFIPEVKFGDKRIFIINGEVVDYCLYRIPQGVSIRGNLAVGGKGEVYQLNDDDRAIAGTVAKWLKEQGVLIAGLDVIGTCLTEINVTSPTGMQQIYNEAGINIAELLFNSLT